MKIIREGINIKVVMDDDGFILSQSVEAHLLYEILQTQRKAINIVEECKNEEAPK